MAQLAITVAGTAIGAYFGYPGLGAFAGSLVGAGVEYLLSSGPPSAPAPQVQDLRVMVSTYGNMIPILFGTNRVSCNVIWCTNLIAVIKPVSAGPGLGMGGGSPDQLQVIYHIDIAIAFGEGVMDRVLRLWGDGKLIFDRRGSAIHRRRAVQATYRFYKGDNLQLPNPRMQARDGDVTPPYRGTSYMMIRGFVLSDFGNHPPNFTAEVVEQATDAFPMLSVETFASDFGNGLILDTDNQVLYRLDYGGGTTAKIDGQGVQLIAGPVPTVVSLNGVGGGVVGSDGYLYLPQAPVGTPGAGIFNFEPWSKVDPVTLVAVATIGTVSHTFGGVLNIPFTNGNLKARGNYILGVCTMGFFSGFHTIIVSDGVVEAALQMANGGSPRIVGQTNTGSDPLFDDAEIDVQSISLNLPSFPRSLTTCTFDLWGISGSTSSHSCTLYRDTVVDNFFQAEDTGSVADYGATGTNPITVADTWDLTSHWSVNGSCSLLYYDDQHALIIQRGTKLLKWDLTNHVVTGEELDVGLLDSGGAFRQGVVEGVLYMMAAGGQSLVTIDVDSWEISETVDLTGFGVPNKTSQQYDPTDDALWVMSGTQAYKLFLHKGESQLIPLAGVITKIEGRIGHTPADIDVTDIDDMIIGYTIPRQMSAQTALAQLCALYDIDAVESDFKIVYRHRGHNPVMTIPYTDLGCYEGGGSTVPEPIPTVDADPLDMPYRVVVKHINPHADYQDGAQEAKRDGALVPSRQEITLDAGTAPLTENQAKGIAERTLDIAWVERRSFNFIGGMKHILLNPTDNVILQDRNISYTVRITQQDIGLNWISKFQGKAEDITIHVPNAVIGSIGGGQGGYFPPPTNGLSSSLAEFMDIVLVQDSDDGPGWYLAGGPAVSSLDWNGETLLKSPDGGNSYSSFYTDTIGATMGRTTTALPDAPGGRWTAWDKVNTVTVRLTNGSLVNETEANVLNGANVAVLGQELIAFMNVTDNGDGTLTLDTLLRGLRGSEKYCTTHSPGERFVLLDRIQPTVDNVAVDELNLLRKYKVLSIGSDSIPNVTYAFTNTGVRHKPLAPTDPLLTTTGGGLNISWKRRSRVGGRNNWADGVDTIPLGEDTESYILEIYNGSTLVRTVATTVSNADYLTADQVTDFGSSQTSLHVKIYQISATVGRGFACDAEVAL